MEPWDDRRGTAGSPLLGRAHRDDAKDRRDETTRPRAPGEVVPSRGSRLPAWAVPVGASLAVLVIVVGTFAVTRGSEDPGSEDRDSVAEGAASPDGPDPDESDDGGAAVPDPDPGASGSADGAPDPAVSGTAAGDLVVTLTDSGVGSETRTGSLSFVLDCSAGSTCTTSGWEPGGDLAQAAPNFFNNYTNLPWTGGDGVWNHTGAAPGSCADVEPDDIRDYVTGSLTVDDGVVTLLTTFDEYEFSSGNGVCSGAAVEFSFTGTVS